MAVIVRLLWRAGPVGSDMRRLLWRDRPIADGAPNQPVHYSGSLPWRAKTGGSLQHPDLFQASDHSMDVGITDANGFLGRFDVWRV